MVSRGRRLHAGGASKEAGQKWRPQQPNTTNVHLFIFKMKSNQLRSTAILAAAAAAVLLGSSPTAVFGWSSRARSVHPSPSFRSSSSCRPLAASTTSGGEDQDDQGDESGDRDDPADADADADGEEGRRLRSYILRLEAIYGVGAGDDDGQGSVVRPSDYFVSSTTDDDDDDDDRKSRVGRRVVLGDWLVGRDEGQCTGDFCGDDSDVSFFSFFRALPLLV